VKSTPGPSWPSFRWNFFWSHLITETVKVSYLTIDGDGNRNSSVAGFAVWYLIPCGAYHLVETVLEVVGEVLAHHVHIHSVDVPAVHGYRQVPRHEHALERDGSRRVEVQRDWAVEWWRSRVRRSIVVDRSVIRTLWNTWMLLFWFFQIMLNCGNYNSFHKPHFHNSSDKMFVRSLFAKQQTFTAVRERHVPDHQILITGKWTPVTSRPSQHSLRYPSSNQVLQTVHFCGSNLSFSDSVVWNSFSKHCVTGSGCFFFGINVQNSYSIVNNSNSTSATMTQAMSLQVALWRIVNGMPGLPLPFQLRSVPKKRPGVLDAPATS